MIQLRTRERNTTVVTAQVERVADTVGATIDEYGPIVEA
jgi:hypothetical protein